jgi:hypothetical protein
MSRRAMLGGTIIAAWVAGLAVLVQREYFRPQVERLAEAALRVSPGAVFFGVMQNGQQVGFASSTIDTTEGAISVVDYLVADLPVGGKARRASARTNVTLSRALRVKQFDLSVSADGPPLRAGGRVEGDSILVFAIETGKEKADSQRVALSGPILLPTLVPLAVALGERPKVGKRYVLPVLDPSTMSPKDVTFHVLAESLFVLNDSAVFDAPTHRWHGVTRDTVRAWQLAADASPGPDAGFAGWIDEQGRVVQTTQLGFVLQRMPYEVAFENWRADSSRAAVNEDRDILETTVIAANKKMDRRVNSLRVRLSGVSLAGLDLDGAHQSMRADTMTITAEQPSDLTAPRSGHAESRYMLPEPLIQSDNGSIRDLANAIGAGSPDRQTVVERLTQWVRDSIRPRVTFGSPSALQVLKTRAGDANEHAQLFVALARSVNIPARTVVGLAYIEGKFYQHAWAEVMLNDWTTVDPTFGQFPADAAHLRFTVGGLARQTDILRLIGNLKIDVLSVNGAPAARPSSNLK